MLLTRHVGPSMRFHSTLLVGLAALSFTGCGLDGGCGYESRGVAARAQISAPTDPHVEFADLSVSQTRGDVPWAGLDAPFPTPVRSIQWSVMGVGLHGHILGARLVDARPEGGTLLELPEQPIVGGTAALAGELLDTPGARTYDRLIDLLVTGGVAIELDTDLPGRERIRQVFQVTGGDRVWSEPSCS
jgi:hypothetical protein